jgi:hypothetical protein
MLKSNCEWDKKLCRASCNKYSNEPKSIPNDYSILNLSTSARVTQENFSKWCLLFLKFAKKIRPHTDLGQLANEFGEFFHRSRKIELITTEIYGIAVQPPSVEYRPPKTELTVLHRFLS